MKENENFVSVATKINADSKKRLDRLERRGKIVLYRTMQHFLMAVQQLLDDGYAITDEMEELIHKFEFQIGWKDAFSANDPGVEKVIGSAIYFLYDADGKRKGCQPVLVNRPIMDDWTQDWNLIHIVDTVFRLAFPERYRRMRLAMAELGCENLLEFIDHLLLIYTEDTKYDAIKKEFEDCMRADNGREYAYGARTKTKQVRTISMFDDLDAQYEQHQERERIRQEQRQFLDEQDED